ncbi:MAG: peptide ABC transporter substrate-binding protein [Candidatus Eisenbacteria bacterium]|uniref:Peptide ABC transporter substrate-binding protein n=1 Tax=Eiseniibacteriota bacterium TaxID=2212470 RepID=A0A849SQS1_UNCEI|nr:peptide ABC transporter substrate-binding protein [Candidatus Eisenbacteria bacterium]
MTPSALRLARSIAAFRFAAALRAAAAYSAPVAPVALVCTLALAGCGAPRTQDAATAAAGDAAYFGDVTPPARDVFTFALGAEPESFDPGLASGQPDGRVARLLFEGLTREDARTLEPRPGQAYRWEITPDGLTYTFHLRPGIAWSNGAPVTAADFRWSWLRVINPATGARYGNLLAPIKNAEEFNKGKLTDENQVGIQAPDDSTLVITLRAPTSYFLYLVQYYTCLPTPRAAIEKYGVRWTRPENIVNNGPFLLDHWRQNERFEFVPNPRYWDRKNIRLERIVGWTVEDLNTCANLYKSGVFDWNPSGYLPSQFIPHLRTFKDFRHGPYQGVYYYSINTTRKPYDDVWVRRALTLCVDRESIARDLLKGSRDPWGNMTPSGYPGYQPPPAVPYDPEKARECLAKAGYPGGKGFPKLSILFNTSEDHRRIGEAIQQMWKRELGIEVELSNQEWGSYLQAATNLDYDVARRSWIGDYLDPNTFLACFITGDGNNRSGWSNARYDALIHASGFELDVAKRMATLREAEAILLDEAPVIPIYHYSTNEMVKPYVRGIYITPLDVHPLTYVWIDRQWREHPPEVASLETRAK